MLGEKSMTSMDVPECDVEKCRVEILWEEEAEPGERRDNLEVFGLGRRSFHLPPRVCFSRCEQ